MKPSSDTLNPVLVKDVRQALRGRLFRVVFALNLSLAMLGAIFALIQVAEDGDGSDAGVAVFLIVHSLYAMCAMGLVPLLANRAMASERDDRSMDALLVSGLSAKQIVGGKLASSCVLLGLFLSASLPFLSLGYALFGLDVLVSLVIILITTLFGASLCLTALLCACLARNRTLSALVLGLHLMLCATCAFSWASFTGLMLQQAFIRTSAEDFLIGVGVWLIMLVALMWWVFSLTVATIAHQEENSSTRVRLACIGLYVSCVGLCTGFWFISGPHADVLSMLGFLVALLSLTNVGVVTEPDQLSRRVEIELGDGRWRFPGAWLLLPGGGRGFSLYLFLVLTLVGLGVLPVLDGVRGGPDGLMGLFATALVCITLVGLPSWLNSCAPRTPKQRMRMRIWMVMLPLGVGAVSMLVGLISGDKDITQGKAWANGLWVAVEAYDGPSGAVRPGIVLFLVLAGVTAALNWRRMREGCLAVRLAQRRSSSPEGHGEPT